MNVRGIWHCIYMFLGRLAEAKGLILNVAFLLNEVYNNVSLKEKRSIFVDEFRYRCYV